MDRLIYLVLKLKTLSEIYVFDSQTLLAALICILIFILKATFTQQIRPFLVILHQFLQIEELNMPTQFQVPFAILRTIQMFV